MKFAISELECTRLVLCEKHKNDGNQEFFSEELLGQKTFIYFFLFCLINVVTNFSFPCFFRLCNVKKKELKKYRYSAARRLVREFGRIIVGGSVFRDA